MLKVKTGLRVGRLLLGAILVAGLAGPAFAGNVYSWMTDDGTLAYTDDPKRIPAKHRAAARERPMGELARYERYTQVSSEVGKPYADRIRERAAQLRALSATSPQGVLAGAVASQPSGLVYSVPVGGDGSRGNAAASVQVPLGGQSLADDEPTTIESIRVRPRNSLASRHWTVVMKGDRPVTVIKGELRQRPLEGKSESEFDL